MAPPALGMIELASVARGVVVADAMVKRAPVRILQTHPISPGKHLVVVVGDVAEVEEAMAIGVEIAAKALVDQLFLPQAHEQLAPLLAEGAGPLPAAGHGGIMESVGVVETASVCSAVLAADAAAKAADVTLLDLRLGVGLGGKAFFTLTGSLDSVQAAVEAAQGIVEPALLLGTELIAQPHEDLRQRVIW